MRVINYLLEIILDSLLWVANNLGWTWLKLKVYKFVLYVSLFFMELWDLRWYIMTFFGPALYPILYVLVFAFFVYLLLRFFNFFENPSAYLPKSRRGRRWGSRRIRRLLGFIFWYLVMLTFVDWYFSYPDSVFFLHYQLGHELMCFIEAFGGLNFILSICAVCVAGFAPGGPIDSSRPLSSFFKLSFKGYRSPFRKRKK